jgi:hypothetical protein
MNEALLYQLAGWKPGSKIAARHFHFYKNEGTKAVFKMRGLVPKEEPTKLLANQQNLLKSKRCPVCSHANHSSARFCSNPDCGMVLSFDEYKVAKEAWQTEEAEKKNQQMDIEHMKRKEGGHNLRSDGGN